jgi:hypothetical protein
MKSNTWKQLRTLEHVPKLLPANFQVLEFMGHLFANIATAMTPFGRATPRGLGDCAEASKADIAQHTLPLPIKARSNMPNAQRTLQGSAPTQGAPNAISALGNGLPLPWLATA